MLDQIAKFIKQNAILLAVSVSLLALGSVVVNSLNFTYLVTFFAIIRKLIMPFDFFIDTTTLMTLVSFAFAIQVGYWAFRGVATVASFFNEK